MKLACSMGVGGERSPRPAASVLPPQPLSVLKQIDWLSQPGCSGWEVCKATWPRTPKNEQPFCYFPATRIWSESRAALGQCRDDQRPAGAGGG